MACEKVDTAERAISTFSHFIIPEFAPAKFELQKKLVGTHKNVQEFTRREN